MKYLTNDEFFKLVAVNSGATDLDNVRDIFYGMVRTISRELKEKGQIKLPDWGVFCLKVHKARRVTDVSNGKIIQLPDKTVVKFKPDYKVKKYFYTIK